MRRLVKKRKSNLNTVERYGCYCTCWCIFSFTKQENVTDVYNSAR